MRRSFLFFLLPLTLLTLCLSALTPGEATKKLYKTQSQLQLLHGSFSEEYHEQWMATKYLPSDATVLELGGNVGRNSCVIAKLLNDPHHLVTLETSPEASELLRQNRDHNGLQFHIETAAISRSPLIQTLGAAVTGSVIPSEVVLPGYFRVTTISFEELERKYQMKFDTLIADCEGGLYYALLDDPDILSNIRLIITENDYTSAQHFEYVMALFKKYGFERVHGDGPAVFSSGYFFEVWKKAFNGES